MVDLIQMLVVAINLLVLARVLMSWVQVDPNSPLAQTIYNLTEPILAPVRNMLPQAGGFDFSPIIVIIGINLIGDILISLLRA